MPVPNLRKILLYGMTRGTRDLLLALRGLLLAALLGPEAFGGWVLFRLAMNYFGFAQMGVRSGLELQVARVSKSGERGSMVLFWRTSLGFVMLVFGGIAALALSSSFFVGDPQVASGMRWFAAGVLTEQVWLTGLVFLRATGDLRRFAILEVANAALQLSLAASFAPIWGLNGAFAGFVLATIVSLLFLARPLPLLPGRPGRLLRGLLKVGFPVLVSLVLGYALATADRLIVASTGDVALLGLYGFAFSLAGLASSLSWIIRTVIYPDVYAGAAVQGEGPTLREHLTKTVLPFSWILPVFLGFGAVFLGPFVSILIPEYVDAIPAARVLLFIGVTAGFEGLGVLGVVAAGRQRYLPVLSAGALILNVILSVTALRCGFGLLGVAGAALVSNLGFGLATLGIVCRLSQMGRPGRFLLQVVFPLLWCTLGSSIIGQLRPGLGIGYSFGSACQLLVVILPLLPGVWAEVGKVRKGQV